MSVVTPFVVCQHRGAAGHFLATDKGTRCGGGDECIDGEFSRVATGRCVPAGANSRAGRPCLGSSPAVGERRRWRYAEFEGGFSSRWYLQQLQSVGAGEPGRSIGFWTAWGSFSASWRHAAGSQVVWTDIENSPLRLWSAAHRVLQAGRGAALRRCRNRQKKRMPPIRTAVVPHLIVLSDRPRPLCRARNAVIQN